jgi:cyanophycin synthetase
MMEKRGYTRDSVPPKGEVVALRGTANISTGGTAVDVTDRVHPDNRVMLERAARICGLDVAGVDFLTRDISRSYRVVGGGICEVNFSPGLRPHLVAAQTSGVERDVVGPIIDRLFPGKSNGRIPIAAVTGTNGKTTTSRMTAHILRQAGGEIGVGCVGLVTTVGAQIDDQIVARGDIAGASGARVLLRDPMVEAAVVETARGGIVKGGMAFDWCDVGAVLNIAHDHVGVEGINSLDELAKIKGRVIEAARKLAVLNADDPRCLALAALKPASSVCLISMLPAGQLLLDHVAKGGLALSLDGEAEAQRIVLHRPSGSDSVIGVNDIPATVDGAAKHNVQNAMAAAGLACGLGISAVGIARALASYDNTFDSNPGRFNIFKGHPFTTVLDLAHNPHGASAACKALQGMKPAGRRIAVLANFGNRHPEHIPEIAQIAAGQFDTFICSRNRKYSEEFKLLRGFPSEEIPKRLAAALSAQGVEASRIMTIDDEAAAIDQALDIAGEGDLLAIFSGESDWCWQRILAYQKTEQAEPAEP